MPFPAARLGDLTATGDAITGPGVPTVLIENVPASVVGDLVNGAACVGAIVTGAFTVLIAGRPAAHVTSSVSGANPVTGVPVSTTIIKGAVKTMIG
jgi:uncharacterized Zn-binding protein involved in type VI secretion